MTARTRGRLAGQRAMRSAEHLTPCHGLRRIGLEQRRGGQARRVVLSNLHPTSTRRPG
jgi:hypothetical protein